MQSKAQLENKPETERWATHPLKQKEKEEQMVQRRQQRGLKKNS